MKRFVLSRPAERDLDQIKQHLLQEASPTVARHVLREIRDACRFLGQEPEAGHLREDLTSLPAKFWPVYSYLVVYDPAAKPVEILRVLHGSRDVESILV